MANVRRTGEDQMDIKQVRELVKLVEESGIEELEVAHKDTTIRIQKTARIQAGQMTLGPSTYALPPMAAPGRQPHGSGPENPAGTGVAAGTAAPSADPVRAKWKDLRSPIVGTMYRAPSPTAESFVKVGDHVDAGQTLCIIEAMKVMNEIEAEFAGVVKEILVENGQPVEAEAVLFLIDPD